MSMAITEREALREEAEFRRQQRAAEDKAICERVRNGWTLQQLAAHYGRQVSKVRATLKRLGLEPAPDLDGTPPKPERKLRRRA